MKKYVSVVIASVILSISATAAITPAVADSTTTVTLTVTGGALQLGSSSGEPVVTDQRGTTMGWTLSDTTDDDGTRIISLL